MSRAIHDAPPSARKVLAALGDHAVKLLVTGGIGTGKSTALTSARRSLTDSGRQVLTVVPVQEPPGPSTALVIDDAHLLDSTELVRLTDLCAAPDLIVIVAAEPRDHASQLRALATAIERQGPRIALGPLPAGEVSRLLSGPSGHPPDAELLAEAMATTAGLPFLVASLSHQHMAASVVFGLSERLRRLDLPDLEALLVTSLSTDLGATELAGALNVSIGEAHRLVDSARATGLVEPSHSAQFRHCVHQAAAQLVGAARHNEIESALLRTQLEFSTLTGELAMTLAEHGVRSKRLADPLADHAAAVHDPAQQARIYRSAVEAGAVELRPALADALALSGDCAGAAMLADELLGSPDAAERAAAARVAVAVATHDGRSAQAADLLAWLGPSPDAVTTAAAVAVHLGRGDLASARAAEATGHAGPPTSAARSARSLAQGLILTVDGRYPAAATLLGQAVSTELAVAATPDSAPALATLAALHSGDVVRAHSLIGRAVDADTAPAMFRLRHRLLQAWVYMQNGQFGPASAVIDPNAPHHRDALWAAALQGAVARRCADAGGLHRHFFAGLEVLSEYSIDLYSLLPLGELWMAAARLGQQDRLRPVIDQAFAVLENLGDPTAWSPPLHWAGVHVGIIAGDPSAVAPHAKALADAAQSSPFAAALAIAGRTWLRVLANAVEADDVTRAARGLVRFGLASDATRLAGQAALQAPDSKLSASMLQIARDLKPDTDDSGVNSVTATAGASARIPHATVATPSTSLSIRERQVAGLLVLGMPYRDIGAQLFISAKTVEHHVARIRRRLGAQSRSEMLSMLRTMLEVDGN